MKGNSNINSIAFMGYMDDIKISSGSNGTKYVADLVYYIPLIGNKNWKIVVDNKVSDIDKVRKLKVYKDGVEFLK